MLNEKRFLRWALQAYAALPYPDTRFPPSPYYRFLRVLAMNYHPRLSVELGCGGAGASLNLAMGSEGIVIGVDSDIAYWNEINHVQKAFTNFTFMRGDSIELASKIHAQYGKADVLFIDTIHTYERTLAEFGTWRPFLSKRAVVCLDDLFRPGMDRAWSELPGRKVRIDELHVSDVGPDGYGDGGFGVIWDIPSR